MLKFFVKKVTPLASHHRFSSALAMLAISALLASCTASTDPKEAGLFGSVYHMSKGTYKKQNEQKREELKRVKQRQQQQQKQLLALDAKLRQQQQALSHAEKSVQLNQQKLRQKKQALQGSRHTYAAQGKQQNELRKQSIKLDNQIKAENARIRQQATHIRTLKKKRDALRQELAQQIKK